MRKTWREERKTVKNEVNRVEVSDIASGRKNKSELKNEIKTDEGEWEESDGDEGESGGGGDSNGRDLVRFQLASRRIQRETLENEDWRVGRLNFANGREIENGSKTDEGEWGGSNGDGGESGGAGGRPLHGSLRGDRSDAGILVMDGTGSDSPEYGIGAPLPQAGRSSESDPRVSRARSRRPSSGRAIRDCGMNT